MSKKKKEGSSWGWILSLALHGTIILLVVFWGIKKYTATNIDQPINVSLSGLEYKGSSDKPGDKVKSKKEETAEVKKEEPKEEKKEEVKEEEPEKEVVKEEKKEEIVKKEEPEKEEPKEEKKEEVKKEEPEKKTVAIETKKEEPKKEVKKEKKKEPKKEVKKKKEPPKKKDETQVARNDVINELKRKNVIEKLKRDETLAELKGTEDSDGLKGNDTEDVAGTTGKVNTALLNVYNNAIWRKIKPKFRIPPNIPTDGSLTANIFFKVDGEGNVSGVKVQQSSGNPAFDNFCINTIISSSPLPPPPSDIAKLVITEGFEIPLSNEEG